MYLLYCSISMLHRGVGKWVLSAFFPACCTYKQNSFILLFQSSISFSLSICSTVATNVVSMGLSCNLSYRDLMQPLSCLWEQGSFFHEHLLRHINQVCHRGPLLYRHRRPVHHDLLTQQLCVFRYLNCATQ